MRAAVLRWTVAILTAALGLFLAPSPHALVDPARCAGLFTAILIAIARISPETPAAVVVNLLNGAAVFMALVVFWHLTRRATTSVVAATAVSLAFAATSMFVRSLAPTPAIGVLAAALAGLTLLDQHRHVESTGSRRRLLIAGGSLALVAIVTPPLTLPTLCAVFALREPAAIPSVRTVSGRALIAAGVVLAGVIGTLLVPALPRPETIGAEPRLACLVPFATASAGSVNTVRLLLTDVGPVPVAAALLGLFRIRRFIPARVTLALLSATLIPLLFSRGFDADPRLTLSPFWIGFWVIASCGVFEMVVALQTTWARRVVAIAMAAMLPVLQLSRSRPDEPAPADRVRGHDEMTATAFSRILSVTPVGGALVVDDALTDLLVRSQESRRLSSRQVVFVDPDAATIVALLSAHRVFVLPRSQYRLGHQGFEIGTNLQPRVSGVAEVIGRRPCRAVTTAWEEIPELLDSTKFALIAHEATARGPVAIYLGISAPSEPHADGWPQTALRGLSGRTFDRRDARAADDLNRQREADRAPGSPLFDAPVVVRLEMWRVPDGPAILPVDVGTAVRGALARLAREDVEALTLCPSSTGAIEPIR